MPFTGERKNEYNREQREKKKLEKSKEASKEEIRELLQSCEQRDKESNGQRYRSEALSYIDLGKIYCGQEYKVVEEDEEDVRKKKKKVVLPTPARADIQDMRRSFDEWLQLRDQARKDLFWLGLLLGHDFFPHVHQVVCDQFVQKNFDGAFSAGYSIRDVHDAIKRQTRFDNNGNPTREALILDPRGFYKSTISRVDCIQWMINVPDIRILLITGEHSLAKAMMKMVKGYLSLPKGEPPSDFHLLFPEYILTGRESGTGTPFIVPCRKHTQVEPTFWVRPIGGNISGWHCDIKKGDDVITDKNANTADVREELNKKYSGSSYVVDNWGFSDTVGTRYYGPPSPDWYGHKLSKAAASSDSAIKVFRRQAWEVRPEYVDIPLKELTEEMVTLTFPEKASFSELRAELLDNEKLFRCQRLNEPAGSDDDSSFVVSFNRDDLNKHLYQIEAAPKEGEVYVCWDWALTAENHSDYSAGAVGRVYKKDNGEYGLCILEVVCDKWDSPELALQIVLLEKKYHPKRTIIEASNGAELLKMYLRTLFKRYQVAEPDIKWQPPSVQKNAKRNRIKGLATLLRDGRLWFVSGAWIDKTFDQFELYTGEPKNRGRKDDIPDAISYFYLVLPHFPSITQKELDEVNALEESQKKQRLLRQQYSSYFGATSSTPIASPDFAENSENGWRPAWPTKKI